MHGIGCVLLFVAGGANGASPEVRSAAAQQIAGLLSVHPPQLPAVLHTVSLLLQHRDWDARVAAAQCLGLLARHFAHWTAPDLLRAARRHGGEGAGDDEARTGRVAGDEPTDGSIGDGSNKTAAAAGVVGSSDPVSAAPPPPPSSLIPLASFDAAAVLAQGTPLLASAGEEYDAGDQLLSAEEQRRNLAKRLGLGGPGGQGLVETTEWIQEQDFA
ncbi:hypothetical protein H632_c2045p0, partial [Helicosporidium sp. ATCC 50920]